MGINAYGRMTMHRLGLSFIVALVTLVGGNFTIAKAKSAQDIRLVLQITVDGLRADREVVERAIADALTDVDGIALAVSTSRLTSQQTNPLVARVRNNHHVSRSGDIYIIQEPYWFLFDKGPVKVMHGSPWRYDTHVPIIFMGPGIQPETVQRRVHPVDVAPTIAAFLGMTPPGSAQGSPLEEVF